MEQKLPKMKRYGVVTKRLPREVILLRGAGCGWGRCTFCDYCIDKDVKVSRNFNLNKGVIDKVTGEFGVLQVIDSGSFHELDVMTINHIVETVKRLKIKTVIVESHTMYEKHFENVKSLFKPAEVKFIVGAETFDIDMRENFMNKGMGNRKAEDFAKYFNWTNLLFGMKGQTMEGLEKDVKLALQHFERFTINIFCDNDTPIKRDNELIDEFYNSSLFAYLNTEPVKNRVEILDDSDRRAGCDLGWVGSKIGGTE